MTVIATDGYLPSFLAKRRNHIPINSILTMSMLAFLLVLSGSLQLILEFGSITFLFVSLLMAFANFKIRHKTQSSFIITVIAIFSLASGTVLIIYYEATTQIEQMFFIGSLYIIISLSAWLYANRIRKLK